MRSASGFSAPVSCGTIRPGWGAKIAEVTTALCAEKISKASASVHSKGEKLFRQPFNTATFNPFPEVIAVPSY